MVNYPYGGVTNALDPTAVMASGSGAGARVGRTYQGTWMGPGNPPPPQAPATERPRIFDYLPGLNIFRPPENIKRQESGGFTFEHFRKLSEQTVVNGAIYHAIEKMKKAEFTFAVVAKPGETETEAQLRGDKDPRITELRQFFESPDKERDWPEWIADAWLQILTCDNLSIYRWPYDDYGTGVTRPGAYAIDILDGDHIQPVIDDTGRVPRDPEAVAYIQWTKGQPRKDFTRQELLYAMCWPSAQRVMGRSPVERLWFYLNVALRRDMTKLSWYTDGNIPAGLWPMDTDHWTPEQMIQGQNFIDLMMSGDPAKRSKLVLLPAGKGAPIFPAEKTLLDPFDDFLARLACFFIGVPVQSLIKEHNRSTSETSREAADEEGEVPRTDFTRRLLNRIIRTWFGYTDIVALLKREQVLDPAVQNEMDDRDLRNGSLQVDEKRQRDGRQAFGLPPGVVGADGTYIPFSSAIERAQAAADAAANPPAPIGTQPPSGAPTDEGDAAKADGPFKYASTQVNLTGPVRAAVLEMAAAIPDDALAEKGRETQPHVTVKYGLQPSVSVSDLRALLGHEVTGTMTFGATAFFAAPKYDVVILTVDSEDLKALNQTIIDGVDTVSTQPNYVPHVTLAYVESGRGHEFAGNGTLVGVEFTYNALHYSDADGNLVKLHTVRSHVRMRPDIAKAQKKNGSSSGVRGSSARAYLY